MMRLRKGMGGNVSMLRLRRAENAMRWKKMTQLRLKRMTQMRLKRMTQMRLKRSGVNPYYDDLDENESDLAELVSTPILLNINEMRMHKIQDK